jgi:hypothetical protein
MNRDVSTWTAVGSVIGPAYATLLELGRLNAAYASMVIQPHLGLSESGLQVLESMGSSRIRTFEATEWPGTRLLAGVATIHEFTLDDLVFKSLLGATDDLAAWRQPNLPEDLALLRNDRSPWLSTVAHEQDAYLTLSSKEVAELQNVWPDFTRLFRVD